MLYNTLLLLLFYCYKEVNFLVNFTGSGSNTNTNNMYVVDPVERKNNALMALRLLCESPALSPHLGNLLRAK